MPSVLPKIIQLLNNNQFHSGEKLGQQLSISRAAVWKIIHKLRNYGIDIISDKNKGYQLNEPLILLETNLINVYLTTDFSQKVNLILLETIDSTNTYLRKKILSHYQLSTLYQYHICLSEHQSQGRGRHNARKWHSPFGRNIYFSCLTFFQKDVSELAGLSLVVSLAVIKTLNHFKLPQPLWVKWPNDILCEAKKLAGILIDIKAEAHDGCYVIIGIGININLSIKHILEQEISQPWTSLSAITGKNIDRNTVTALLIHQLIISLDQFRLEGLSAFLEDWKKTDFLFNKNIRLKNHHKIINGKSRGINTLGHLLVESSDGSLQAYSSGDTSVIH